MFMKISSTQKEAVSVIAAVEAAVWRHKNEAAVDKEILERREIWRTN